MAQRSHDPDTTFVPVWGERCWAVLLRSGLPPQRSEGRDRNPHRAVEQALAGLDQDPRGVILLEFAGQPTQQVELIPGTVVWRGQEVPAGVAVAADLQPGLHGIEVAFADGSQGTAYPTDALLDDRANPDELLQLAIRRAGYAAYEWEKVQRAMIFQTWSVLIDSDGEVQAWQRYGLPRAPLSKATIRAAVQASAERLVRNTDEFGKYAYSFTLTGRNPPRTSRNYNIVRHAGTTWTLLMLGSRSGDAELLETGRRGLQWLNQWLEQEDDRWRIVYDREAKLGTQALALLAYVELARVNGLEAGKAEREGLLREILSRQDPSGLFLAPGGGLETSPYFPGEACLALAELGHLDPDTGALDAARLGVEALLRFGADGKGAIRLDNWLPQAVEAVHRADQDPRWVDAAWALGERISRQQYHGDEVAADWAGGMHVGYIPRGSSTSAYLEGLGSALAVLLRADDSRAVTLRTHMRRGSEFLLRTQVLPEEAFLCRDPALAVGGFRAGLMEGTFRVDFDQHAIGALLWALETLEH